MSKVKNIRLWLEDTEGVIPTSPKVYLVKLKEGASITETQNKQRNDELGNDGEASSPTYGATDIAVNLPFILGTKNAPLIAHLLYGAATSGGAATGTAWAASTVTALDDMVNHSNGTVTLTAIVAGTTDASEPDVTGLSVGDTIVDGTVTWVYSEKLYSFVGQNKSCLPTFGMEIEEEDCDGVKSYTRANGCRINSSPTGQAGDNTSYDMTLDGVALSKEDSATPDVTYEAMTAKAGYSEVDLRDQVFYNYQDSTFLIDDVETDKVVSYNMTTTRNATTENLLNQKKESNEGIIDPSGTLSAYFTTAQYQDAYKHTDFKAEMRWEKQSGAQYICANPQVKAALANRTLSTSTKTKIEGLELDAYGTPTSPSCTYNIIAPVLYPL